MFVWMEYTVSATACLTSHEGFLESCGLHTLALQSLFATVLPSFRFVFSLDLISLPYIALVGFCSLFCAPQTERATAAL